MFEKKKTTQKELVVSVDTLQCTHTHTEAQYIFGNRTLFQSFSTPPLSQFICIGQEPDRHSSLDICAIFQSILGLPAVLRSKYCIHVQCAHIDLFQVVDISIYLQFKELFKLPKMNFEHSTEFESFINIRKKNISIVVTGKRCVDAERDSFQIRFK